MVHGKRSTYIRGCRCVLCTEAHREYARAYRYAGKYPERKKAYNEEHYQDHREEIRAKQKAYYQENPGVFQRKSERRRSHRRDAFIEDVDRNELYEMHGGCCGICEGFIDKDGPEALELIARGEAWFHVDHVIPLSKGGFHGYANVQPAHPSCNWRKHASFPNLLMASS